MARRMCDLTMCYVIILFTLFDLVVETKMSVHDNSHDFIQTNNEVRYIVDGVPVRVHKELHGTSGSRASNVDDNSAHNSNFDLKFEPPLLDFKERCLGIPHHEKVTLFNINKNQTIHMSSISGSTVHFHSSFFEDKMIPPLGNTTFNVVFLGRVEGEIESSLFIHTSEGSFKYGVKGSSVSSPYRLRPLVGAKVPLNSSYSQLISMYNPHPTPLQIVEIYSSGGDFHLELPSGELEGPKHLWEIPPFNTKPVIKVRLTAESEKNHTAYVRIKVNNSDEVLVVPIEVEVTPSQGLYFPENVLDLGYGGSLEKPKQIKLLLYNSLKKPVRIQNIVATPVSKAVEIRFEPIKVPPDTKVPTEVATLIFDWKTAYDTMHFSGKLIVKSNQSQHKLIIPYMAQVLEGSLTFNASAAQYCSDLGSKLDVRNFTVTNNYQVPVAVTEVSLPKEAQAHFVIQNFTSHVILKPRETVILFRLAFRRDTVQSDMLLDSAISLHTNVSTISVPLFYYSGRLLKVLQSRLNDTYLNFGLVGSRKVKWLHFALLNTNPVAIELRGWNTNLTGATVEFVGVWQGNRSTVFGPKSMENLTNPLSTVLMPGQYGVFRVTVVAPQEEGVVLGEVYVKTQFENIAIATKMEVANGDLQIPWDSLFMNDCFPGKLCSLALNVKSFFSRSMEVTGIASIPTSTMIRLSLNKQEGEALYISPLTTSHVADMTFNPILGCRNDCYLNSPTNAAANSKWMNSLSLPLNTYKSDISLINSFYDRFLAMTAKSSWRNVSVKLDTTEVMDFTFNVGVKLTWPEIVLGRSDSNSSVLEFPLTQIGNVTYKNLSLTNPSSNPLSVQLVVEWIYLKDVKKLSIVPKRYENLFTNVHNVSAGVFILYSSDRVNKLHGSTHQQTLTYSLRPGETVITKIGFTPRSSGISSALLFIRNNITVLDVVKLTGRSAEAHFKFGNRKPGSTTPLLFELAKKHLKDCEREKNRKYPIPNLTVKRSFTARNTGEVPIQIKGFKINNLPCEGYGFRILNCDAFKLPPNGTRKIDIAFTPDFTLARIQRTLNIETSLGVLVNYTLITTLPPAFLASCSSVLARPPWEPLLYYSAISFMIFLLFCVLAAAFLESDRILKCALVAMARDRMTRPPAEYKTIYADVHKHLEKMTKQIDPPEWTANCQRQPEKPRDIGNNVMHKTSSWPQPPERRFSSETEMKEQVTITQKFDEAEGSCSNVSSLQAATKSKKKLGKRNSNNSDTCDTLPEIPSVKKTWGSVFTRSVNVQTLPGGKFKVPATVPEPESKSNITQIKDNMVGMKKNQESRKEIKRTNKSALNNKIKPVPEPVLCSEEESSSSTTESSNNEEMEKDQESSGTSLSERTHKVTPKKVKGKPVDYRDNYEGDCDDDDYERDSHKKRWKPTSFKPTTASPPEVTTKVETPKPSSSLQLPYKLKLNSLNRERKDKNGFKRSGEKTHNAKPVPTAEVSQVTTARVSPSPPPRPSNVWTENRASFSDVVARNDSPSYSNIVAPRRQAQPPPQAAVQPVRQHSVIRPPGLGPIGPKKPTTSTWGNFVEPHQLTAQFLQQENNSLFTNSFREPQQTPLAADTGATSSAFLGEPWHQPNMGLRLLPEEQRQRTADEYQQQTLFKESWPASLWDPLYTPAVGNAPTYSPAEVSTPHETAGTLWWNSLVESVWSPPTPQEDPPLQAYDPFRSLNNIWTPQSSPWANKPRND